MVNEKRWDILIYEKLLFAGHQLIHEAAEYNNVEVCYRSVSFEHGFHAVMSSCLFVELVPNLIPENYLTQF